jgi:hypothetical protein
MKEIRAAETALRAAERSLLISQAQVQKVSDACVLLWLHL